MLPVHMVTVSEGLYMSVVHKADPSHRGTGRAYNNLICILELCVHAAHLYVHHAFLEGVVLLGVEICLVYDCFGRKRLQLPCTNHVSLLKCS